MASWSEIPLSEVTGVARLDAEYFRPEYLRLVAVLRIHAPIRVEEFASVTDGIHASPDVVDEAGIRYLSAKCVKDNDFALGDTLQISEKQHNANKRTQLRSDDVLVTTVGTIGNTAVVTDELLPANADRHLGIIRIKNDSDIDPYYLSTFLNTKFGRFQTLRESTGNVQLNLFIEKLKTLQIVKVPSHEKVAQLARNAYQRRRDAQAIYSEAESELERVLELGAIDLAPRLFYERSFSELSASSRFDAEYFQPPKEVVKDALRAMPGKELAASFDSVRRLWQPTQATANEVIRNYDLTDALQPFLDESVDATTSENIASTKKKIQPGDLVVSRLRSYLKEIAVVLQTGEEPMVGSTEFVVLRPRDGAIRVETLLVYLRCKYVQTILKWCQDGSNHPRFHEDELMNLWVPDAIREHQHEIAEKVKESIRVRRESRRLLDEAKRLVEQAVLEGGS